MSVLSRVPSKIVCVGRNYADHAKELGNEVPLEPLLFFKPPSALLEPGQPIRLPAGAGRIDFEGELCVVIGRRGRNIPEDQALSFVRGFTCANDVTARDLQKKDGQWTRAKGFDTFCPVGPSILPALDAGRAALETRVNGERRQFGWTTDMIFGVPRLVAYISSIMTLEEGDLILTGTPPGVGPLSAGDRVEVEITGIGILSNPVEAE